MEEEFEEIKIPEAEPIPEEQRVGLQDEFIREISDLLDQNYTDRVQELCRELPPADAAELIDKLDSERRYKLAEVLEDDLDPETFSHLNREVLYEMLEHMSARHIASVVSELDSDDAIRLVENLDEDRRGNIMRHLSRKLRAVVEEGLTYPEYSAGRLMQREFVAIPQFWTVGKAVDYLRAAAITLPDRFYNIFVVDPMHHFAGSVNLDTLLCAQRSVKVDALLSEDPATIPVHMEQDQIALLFRRKELLSAPVLDESGQLIGVITVDDVVDIIHQEAEEDILKLGGVSDSDIFSSTTSTVRARFWWLLINLFTAFLATAVISQFEEAISKLVILAALMPIIASMGGNAGTQTLAVVVRAIATKELTDANTWRTIFKELMVGSINGLLFGLVMIIGVTLWYSSWKLGAVMAVAMLLNLAAAGFFGAVIPLFLNRAGYDPAHSATVLLTTVTDVVGFLAFLGLAAWLIV